jgi:hypothetical protein
LSDPPALRSVHSIGDLLIAFSALSGGVDFDTRMIFGPSFVSFLSDNLSRCVSLKRASSFFADLFRQNRAFQQCDSSAVRDADTGGFDPVDGDVPIRFASGRLEISS